ncbi:hypothetical protein JHK85_008208 [Glycine max]|uniref:Uncharacterized protein n=1 Tax=Glycine max TaxID=3847 RepID=K7KG15_SOYBN|nr:hypothetical protein JHK85_008208 [Glycine max]KAG5072759.1 hypothetical protein JHK86_007970 [Glycine max]KAH1070877.1 hypothetical protein GYH30_007756 [Glycine max]
MVWHLCFSPFCRYFASELVSNGGLSFIEFSPCCTCQILRGACFTISNIEFLLLVHFFP